MLVFVIAILAVIGMYMIVLARDANTIVFQTERAYMEVCGANMVASGRAWVQTNGDMAAGTTELDTSEFGVRNSALCITQISDERGGQQAEVRSQCGRMELSITRGDSFLTSGPGEVEGGKAI